MEILIHNPLRGVVREQSFITSCSSLSCCWQPPRGICGPSIFRDPYAAAVGLVLGLAVVFFEIEVRKTTLKRLFGAAFGSLLGIMGAYLISLILARAIPANSTTLSFIQILLLLWMGYVGLVVGASKGEMLNLGALGGLFGGEQVSGQTFKILDTSVIIDGRIADIVETGFLDGTLVIPQFVLRELQLVADSADSLKRNRGRRGLDILQKIQKDDAA